MKREMWGGLGITLAAMILASCATTAGPAASPEPRVVIQRVEVPIPVPCDPATGPEPDYPDTDAALRAAPNVFERVKLLAAGRIMRIARDVEKSVALAKCAAPGS